MNKRQRGLHLKIWTALLLLLLGLYAAALIAKQQTHDVAAKLLNGRTN